MRSQTATNTSSRRVAGAGAEARRRAVDAVARRPRPRPASSRRPSPGCGGRGSRSRSPASSLLAQQPDARRDVVRQHVAGRVGARRCSWRRSSPSASPARAASSGSIMCAIIRKPTVSSPSLRGRARCAARRRRPRCSGWRRGSCARRSPRAMLQIVDRADAGQQQRRHLRLLHAAGSPRAGTPRRCAAGKP